MKLLQGFEINKKTSYDRFFQAIEFGVKTETTLWCNILLINSFKSFYFHETNRRG